MVNNKKKLTKNIEVCRGYVLSVSPSLRCVFLHGYNTQLNSEHGEKFSALSGCLVALKDFRKLR